LDSDFVRDRDMVAEIETADGPLRLLKSPIRFDGERGEMRLPPRLHENTDEILDKTEGTAP
jgi:crotonobetainyl-CoA:carnitine CoA-transferase CaiB-like acyl-CoA transferase